jgi:two-component system phosphate regulon sensor histidine kinase PhoR
MKRKLNHVAILLAASMLALIGLVFFQYKWIAHSKHLSDEIFHQQVSMALCSTIEECEGRINCVPASNSMVCTPNGAKDTNLTYRTTLVADDQFQTELKRSLDFYNIDLPFQIAEYPTNPTTASSEAAPACVVSLPAEADQEESFISVVFPSKDTFMLDKLKYMIGASLLILLFTAIVLLLANWWLHKQKGLLRRNVDMYNNMAHEFRTPLTNINLAAQLMSKKIEDPKAQKFLDIITKENSRLIHQVEHVLNMAKIDNGVYLLKNESIPLQELLSEVTHEMEIQIDEKKAVIHTDQISPGVLIYGDRQHLTNVFRNLIDNALKYSVDQPEISITARDENDGILISVQDNGIGIPASQSRMIFEKFQRLPNEQEGEPKGFGLGLAYVKRVIEMHKGFIQVDCALSKGSRFNVFLPKLS